MLGQLSQYPPSVVKQILAVIQSKVMSLGESVPGSLQVEPFADSALSQVKPSFCMHAIRRLSASTRFHMVKKCLRWHAWIVQIAAVAAWEADDSAADRDSSTAVACAAAAQRMLLQLMTETSHGIALPLMSAVSAPVRDDVSGETFGAGPGYPSLLCRFFLECRCCKGC